ncbi:hypothetical protein HanLR1_Chr09g0303901 [Helianthus annuus]|nr:hypothetical protein HanHA89_Chr09g0324361 [Helianthus annuus]KAJ0706161.1 hypothetical protein HanLR1_Chr09g0303901 [Helianthus annuus]
MLLLIHVKVKETVQFLCQKQPFTSRSNTTGPCSNSTGQRFSFATNTQSKG